MSGFLYKFGKAALGLMTVVPMFGKVNKDGVINTTTSFVQSMATNGTLTLDGPGIINNVLGGLASSGNTTLVSGSSFWSPLVSGSFFWSLLLAVLGILWHHFFWHILWFGVKWVATAYCTRFVAAQDVHPLARWILNIPAAPLDVPDPEEVVLNDAFNNHVTRRVMEFIPRLNLRNFRFALYLQHQANEMRADAMRAMLYMYTIYVVALRTKDQLVSDLRTRIDRQLQEIRDLNKEITGQREYRRKLAEENRDLKLRPYRLARAQQALEKVKSWTRKQIDECSLQAHYLWTEISRQAKVIYQLRYNERVFDYRIAQLNSLVDCLEQDQADLEGELGNRDTAQAALDKTIGSLGAQKKRISKSRNKLAKEKRRASATISQLTTEAQKSSVVIIEKNKTITTMAATIANSVSSDKHLEMCANRDEQVKQEARRHQNEVDDLEEEHREKVKEMEEERRKETEKKDAKIADLEEQLHRFRAQVPLSTATAEDVAQHKMDAERAEKRLSMKAKKEKAARKMAEKKAVEAVKAREGTQSQARRAAKQHKAVVAGNVQLTES
ncbi:MAG: hypothetical protein Q9212_007471, partial [Teloschistes hypoglaucus]